MQTGDFDVAVKTAQRAFLSRHAITAVGGTRRWQKDAPEKRYAVYGDARDTAWIEQDALDHAKKQYPKSEGVVLTPLPGSFRDEKPAYRLAVRDGDEVKFVDEPFTPDVDAERSASVDDQSNAVERAKALDARLKVESAQIDLARLRLRVGRTPISREANKEALEAAEENVQLLMKEAAPLMQKSAERKAAWWEAFKKRAMEAAGKLGQGAELNGAGL